MISLIDTHCHIHSSDFSLPIPEVEARALAADVEQLICVGCDAEDSRRAVAFVQNRPNMWASIGIHPHEASGGETELKKLGNLLKDNDIDTPQAKRSKIIAVGECGLDYFYSHSSKADQAKALRYQIELALKHDLPLIFHIREAFADFWPIFDSYQNIRGVVHSFTDTQTQLDELLARGLYVGVNGIITFTKNQWQLDVARQIPLDKLVLETDAPFLTPVPHRGTVNEPARVRLVADFLAELREDSLQSIAAATTHNARQLFSI